MGGGDHGENVTYKGMTLHKPKRWHTVTGKGLCAVMWFWVLYRAKQDGPVVLVGDILGRAMMTTATGMIIGHPVEKLELEESHEKLFRWALSNDVVWIFFVIFFHSIISL